MTMPSVTAHRPLRRPNVSCDLCGERMYRRPSTLAMNAGKFCSRACRNRTHRRMGPRGPNPLLQGPNNPAWKGGWTFFRKHGRYKPIKYVRCPSWLASMARTDGYVMEHRLVMATWAGRPLQRVEVVHHVNHDPQDNALTNLELWPDNRSHKLAEHGRFVSGAVNQWFPKA
jgi:hypothetical protein